MRGSLYVGAILAVNLLEFKQNRIDFLQTKRPLRAVFSLNVLEGGVGELDSSTVLYALRSIFSSQITTNEV